jgi:hypothetical protein
MAGDLSATVGMIQFKSSGHASGRALTWVIARQRRAHETFHDSTAQNAHHALCFPLNC